MSRRQAPEAYLLVEGKDDKHVIQNLCRRHGLAVAVREPEESGGLIPLEAQESGGIDKLLARVSARLKEPGVEALGIVVDADLDLAARWAALHGRLTTNGYTTVPSSPQPDGWVSSEPDLRRVGLWLMPDNQIPGILEDFVVHLIPPQDALRTKAETVIQEIERENLHRYQPAQRSKALIHTWLAWQETPGQPMGLAITAQTLGHDSPLARAFVDWLRRLFDL